MLYSCKVQATGSRLKYGSPARLRRYDLDDNADQPKKVPMNRAARTRLAERARYMRKNMTEAEKILWFRFLREYPIRFSNQIIVGPYIVDFYCRKVRLSIELDGSQHYEEVHRKYDEIRTTYLEMEGIKELRFPNSYIWDHFEGVCETIHREVERRRNDLPSIPLSEVRNKR